MTFFGSVFGGGQHRQPEVPTLLIQVNVLLTTTQLHRTPAKRGEGGGGGGGELRGYE